MFNKMKALTATALASTAALATSAFADTVDPVSQVQTAVQAQMGEVSGFVITLGIAIIGIAFAIYVLKRGKHSAGGGV